MQDTVERATSVIETKLFGSAVHDSKQKVYATTDANSLARDAGKCPINIGAGPNIVNTSFLLPNGCVASDCNASLK